MCDRISGGEFLDRYSEKQVSLLLIAVFAGSGILWTICSRSAALDFLVCAGTGLIFVGISIITEGAVGMGDGWLIMALGTVMSAEEFFMMLFLSLICSAVWAGITMIFFIEKEIRKYHLFRFYWQDIWEEF